MRIEEALQVILHAEGLILIAGTEEGSWKEVKANTEELARLIVQSAKEEPSNDIDSLEGGALVLSLVAQNLREMTGDKHSNGISMECCEEHEEEAEQ